MQLLIEREESSRKNIGYDSGLYIGDFGGALINGENVPGHYGYSYVKRLKTVFAVKFITIIITW